MSPCERCGGACCEDMHITNPMQDEDHRRWFAFHGEEANGGVWLDTPCAMLKDGRCTIYETRPQVCRIFTVGGLMCRLAIIRKRGIGALNYILGNDA